MTRISIEERNKRSRARYVKNRVQRLKRQRELRLLVKDDKNKLARERNHTLKIEILSYYAKGAPKCSRCGIEDIDVLCLDHITGGGNKIRVGTIRGGANFYARVKRAGFPEGLQVLCANCNLKKWIRERK